MTQTCRFLVSGRVQGVFYRASTRDQAVRLGLDGWVRNLHNGDVEVVASGQAEAITALEAWLWAGPPAASVASVAREEMETGSGLSGFMVRPTA